LPIDREEAESLSFDELRRRICETEPLRPSKRISTLRDDRKTMAERDRSQATTIERSVSNELDWIVMKAINKDRLRRYQSPRELGIDVHNFLNGDIINACPPSWIYRVRKLATRHRTGFLIASTILLSLGISTVVSTSQAIKAMRASADAAHNQKLADEQVKRITELLYAEDTVAATREYLAGNHHRVNRILERHRSSEKDSLRGFEWYVLSGLQPVERDLIHTSNDRVNDLAVSGDQSTVIVVNSSDRISCVDLSDGLTLAEIDAGIGWIHDVAITSNNQILVAGDEGRLHGFRWDQAGKQLIPEHRLQISKHFLNCIKISSTELFAWAGDAKGAIFEIDLTNWTARQVAKMPGSESIRDIEITPMNVLAAQANVLYGGSLDRASQTVFEQNAWQLNLNEGMNSIRDIAVSANGQWIACGQLLGMVSVVRSDAPSILEFAQLMPADVHSVAFSPSGDWIAAGDAAGYIHLLPSRLDENSAFLDRSSSRARRLQSWKAHAGKVEHLQFVKSRKDDKPELLSAGRDKNVVVSRPFDRSTVSFQSLEDQQSRALDPKFSSLLQWGQQRCTASVKQLQNRIINELATTADALRLNVIHSGEELAVLVDEKTLLTASLEQEHEAALLWQAADQTVAQKFAVSDDGSQFALCLAERDPRRHRIEVFKTGEAKASHSLPSNLANDLAFSPSGNLLAYVWNNDIALFDLNSGKDLRLLSGHSDSVHGLAFSPDGAQLASVSSDRQLNVWSVLTGKLLWSQRAHENRALDVAYHPFLPTIATVGADAIIRLWTSRAGVSEESARLVGEFPTIADCHAIAFSEDGRSLLVHHAGVGVTELRAEGLSHVKSDPDGGAE
jgi:WD40 repeat protein